MFWLFVYVISEVIVVFYDVGVLIVWVVGVYKVLVEI